jgi:hypothetical protein
MELNTIGFNDFVKLGTVIWLKGFKSVQNFARESGIFRTMSISENSGNTREFSSIESNEYLSYKAEGDQAKRGKVQQGYTKTMTKYRVGENIGITYEMRTENKYPEVVNELLNGGRKGPNTIDLDLSHRITFGTATSYTDRDGRSIDVSTGDALSLFSTAHLLRGTSTTYRNRLAGNPQLSRGALEGLEQLVVEQTLNQFGEKMSAPFDILWTTDDPNTINTALEHLRSVAAPDAAHSGVTNVYKMKYRHIVLPRVATNADGSVDSTKRRYFGIASSVLSSAYLGVWEEPHFVPASSGSNAEDVQTDDWDFRVRAGYGICVVDGKWNKFSSGTDEA